MTEQSRDRLSTSLRDLRKAAGLNQPTAAARSGTSQASISRWESARSVPSLGDLRALLRVYGVSGAVATEVEQLVVDLRGDATPSSRVTMRRAGDMQRRFERVEHGSALIRTFQVVLVPGLLQVSDYARAVFSSGDDVPLDQIEDALAGRLKRPAVLDDESRHYVAVLSEGVLRWPLAGPSVMIRQIEHMHEQSRRPNVRIGIIPSTHPVNVAPTHGFDLFDERAAVVGLESATAFLTDPHDVAMYVKLFRDLERLAVFGDEMRDVLRTAVQHYSRFSCGSGG